jgi:ubiquinone/menaquinone biosynthesis C-methylase UbiE
MEMNFLEKLVANSRVYNFFFRRTLLRWFLDFCSLEGDCLEIGCGKGESSLEIVKRFNVRLTAVDVDSKQVALARKTLSGTGVKIQKADATRLPFKDGSFDSVVETFVLVHISDYPKALREIHRVLRKGGKLFLMDQSRYLFWPLSMLLPFDHFDGKFTKGEMKEDLLGAGFEIIDDGWKDIFIIHAKKM